MEIKDVATTTVKTVVVAPKKQSLEDNYDEEYDDDLDSDDKAEDNEVVRDLINNDDAIYFDLILFFFLTDFTIDFKPS